MSDFNNELTDAEIERLAILAEEMGEAQQAIGKILRHGYESYNPDDSNGRTNRRELERELGDVVAAMELMTITRDVNDASIDQFAVDKMLKILKYSHHQSPVTNH